MRFYFICLLNWWSYWRSICCLHQNKCVKKWRKNSSKERFYCNNKRNSRDKKTAEFPRNTKKTQNILIVSAYWTVFNCWFSISNLFNQECFSWNSIEYSNKVSFCKYKLGFVKSQQFKIHRVIKLNDSWFPIDLVLITNLWYLCDLYPLLIYTISSNLNNAAVSVACAPRIVFHVTNMLI